MTGTTAYPGAVDSYGDVVDNVDTYSASHVNDLRRAAEAIETALGANLATVLASALAAAKVGVSAEIFLSAGAAVPKTTSGCAAAAQIELTTNKQNLKVLDFDKDAEEYADFTFTLPSDYDGGTMTARFFWRHAATTTNFGVVWGIKGRVYTDGDDMDQAPGTAQVIADTGGNTGYEYKTGDTPAITWAGTPAGNKLIILTVYRKAADASDTLAIDARLIGVQLSYTRS